MKRIISAILCLAMLFSLSVSTEAYTSDEMSDKLCTWLKNNITVEQAKGEIDPYLDWTVFSLARAGDTSYSEDYAKYIIKAVNFAETLTLTDCSRIALAVSAVGLDAANVGGVKLLDNISNANIAEESFTTTLAYALMALTYYGGSGAEKYIDALLAAQRSDGGFNAYVTADENAYWTLNGEVDATGMVLQALAPYKNDKEINDVIQSSLKFIKAQMKENCGFEAYGAPSAESTSQVLAALCELGIDPLSDEYTNAKSDSTIISALSEFINTDGGARGWDGKSNLMTSYQLLFALDAYEWYNSKYGISLFDCECLNPECTCISHSKYAKYLLFGTDEILCKIIAFFSGIFNLEYVCCKHK